MTWLTGVSFSGLVVSMLFLVFVILPQANDLSPQALSGLDWTQCRVEQGTYTLSGTSGNVTLSTSIADTTQAFLLVDASGISTVNGANEHMVSGYIASSSTLTFERESSSGDAEIAYALVECFNNEFAVQRGQIALGSGVQSNTATISAVDTSRSLVLVSSRSTDTAAAEDEALVTGELASSTSVLVERSSTHASTTNVRYEVVDFASATGVSVQTGEVTFGSGVSTTDTISSVDTSRAWLYCSWDATDIGLRQSSVNCDLTNSTTVTFSRYASSSYTNRVRYYVIEFPADTVTVQRDTGTQTSDSCTNNTQCDHDITISPVASTDKAFVFETSSNSGTGTAFPRNRWIAHLTSTGNLRRSNWMSSSSTADDNIYYWQVIEFPPNVEVDQSAYRFFGNDDSTDVGTPLALQDTAATLGSTEPFRLRLLSEVAASDLLAGSVDFKLQFAARSGTCDTGFVGESYSDVTGATAIAFYDNAAPADGDTLTQNANDPTTGATVVAQTYEEINNFTPAVDIAASEAGLWDFALVDNGAPFSTTYCFRVVTASGGQFDTYTVVPEITTYSGNLAPSASFNSAAQATDGTKAVSISLEVEDNEGDDVKAKLEFDNDATCDGPWTAASLDESSGASADYLDSGGAPSVLNTDTYQIGSQANERIVTDSGSNTIGFGWLASTDAPGAVGDYCLRLTTNDDAADQAPPATQTISLDLQDPTLTSASVSPSSGTIEAGDIVTVTLDVGESGLTIGSIGCTINDHDVSSTFIDALDNTYQLQYAPVQGDDSWDAGALPLECELIDAYGNSLSISSFTDSNTLEGDIAAATSGGGQDSACPNITGISFMIDGGAEATDTREVRIDLEQNNATEIIISESIGFADTDYQPISSAVYFTLSEGEGTKTIYARMRSACQTSVTLSDSILYDVDAPLEQLEQPDDETSSETEATETETEAETETSETDQNTTTTENETTSPAVEYDEDEIVGDFAIGRSVVDDAAPTAASFATRLASEVENYYADGSITFRTGALAGQTRRVIAYSATTRTITVDPPFSEAPASGDEFTIIRSTAVVVIPTLPAELEPSDEHEELPTLEEILREYIEDEEAIQILASIDGGLDGVRAEADDVEVDLATVRRALTVAAEEMVDTLSAIAELHINTASLEEVLLFDESEVQNFLDVQSKIADIRALAYLTRRLIENDGAWPVFANYLTFGSVEFKYMMANPLETSQVFRIDSVLPNELLPEHIFGTAGLSLVYADSAETYHAAGDLEVAAGELQIRNLEARDVWVVADEELHTMQAQVTSLQKELEGTHQATEAALLGGSINLTLDLILAEQAASFGSPQEHILIYRQNLERLERARLDLDLLKTLPLRAEYDRIFSQQNYLIYTALSVGLLVLVLMASLFAVLLRREKRMMRLLGEIKPKSSAKKTAGTRRVSSATSPARSSLLSIDVRWEKIRFWLLLVSFSLALISLFLAYITSRGVL